VLDGGPSGQFSGHSASKRISGSVALAPLLQSTTTVLGCASVSSVVREEGPRLPQYQRDIGIETPHPLSIIWVGNAVQPHKGRSSRAVFHP